jgi:hypothetical protein
MELSEFKQINLTDYNKTSECEVYIAHVKINNIRQRVEEITKEIADESWISSLTPSIQIAYKARARKTIKKIVNDILLKVKDKVTEDFGEYLVSITAKDILRDYKKHGEIPLAELLGKKKSGNSGFDFHTLTHNNIISFGEAKYTTYKNPYSDALSQICSFIDEEKDLADILHLEKFVPEDCINKLTNGEKAFVAAFSLNAKKTIRVFNNIIKNSKAFDELLKYKELYLIGVQICR